MQEEYLFRTAGGLLKIKQKQKGKRHFRFQVVKSQRHIQGPFQLFCINRMAQIHRLLLFMLLFLGWSMSKLIGYSPKLGNIKFHDIHHKIEKYLGYSAEKHTSIILSFGISVLDHLLSTRVKKSVPFPSTSPLFIFLF